MRQLCSLASLLFLTAAVVAGDANRLTYLDGTDPYYVHRNFPKLVTPQWVGEDAVEAVVILAIDDMRDSAKYEAFLRPILQRLKQIDGRAPVSIMSCQVKPDDPQLQTWLKEGLSLETHTYDHPCPLLGKGDFAKAVEIYEKCVDLLSSVPNSKPVAFRMPCCDSLNTNSPRFYAEIFNKTTAKGNFLNISSSVFNLTTANDPALPRDLVLEADGSERFRKYLPADRAFGNVIEDYPYPYVIGRLCWEFPCAVPSDWEAQHLHKPSNPVTVRDWKALLDATVIKQGVMNLVFHPHGWIKNEQIVELIDHAVAKHGKKVKFLTFKEAHERLTKNLLHGQPLRNPETGRDNGVRLLDVNNDGYLDVLIGNDKAQRVYLWSPNKQAWVETDFPIPVPLVTSAGQDNGVRLGVLHDDYALSLLLRNDKQAGLWHYRRGRWLQDARFPEGFDLVQRDRKRLYTTKQGIDQGLRLRDVLGLGRCQIIVSNQEDRSIVAYDPTGHRTFDRLPVALPERASIVTTDGKDAGVRFVDVDEDGHDDILVSNENGYGLYLYDPAKADWSRKVLEGKPGDKNALPLITRKGENMGAWFYQRALWVQNENTAVLKDLVARRTFNELLDAVEPTAKSPEASLKSIQVRPGFEVELVAAEPLVQDPIAMAWGPDGKLWVVEMGDYPLGIDGKGKPGGRVKYLEDTNGDGKYTKATIFVDGLPFPTGVLPWRKGVLITCAPHIYYAEDTKGTGKADKLEPIYTGFREGNQQHRVNSLVWGLDNWLYCANGDSGGSVKSVKTGKTVNISGRDLRIRPDSGDIDLQSGQTQYGRSRDDWNHWFGNNNSNPMYHYALADHYIRRNPHIAAPDGRVQVSVVPGASQVYPVSRTTARFNSPESANHFTSACSAIVYRDELFPPPFRNSTFVSEPVHNLVHREIIIPNGTTFFSRRAADEQQSEFLASTDNWFRPTMIQTGPDGALWIADMYRAVIEHPEWIPKNWQDKLDLRAGHDKGRIYRVYPVGSKPRRIPRLDQLDTAGLVAALDSPSGWQRDTAQMMLLWKADKAAVSLLEKLASESQRPLARVHALCTLDGLDVLKPVMVQRALADKHPAVRQHAVRLCEGRFANSELGAALVKMTADTDPQVRLQLAYTLGEWDDPRAGQALGDLAVRNVDDRFISAAVMSSLNEKNLDEVVGRVTIGMVRTVLTRPRTPTPAALIENLMRMTLAVDHDKWLAGLVEFVASPEKEQKKFASWQFGTLAGLLDALDQRNSSLTKLRAKGGEDLKTAVEKLAGLFHAAREVLKNGPKDEQLLAVRLLGRGLDHQAEDLDRLAGLLSPQTDRDLQAAAITALGRLSDAKVPEVLLSGWKGYGPALRGQVLDVLFSREDRLKVALDAMEKKQILASELDAVRRQRLVDHKSPAIRERAVKLLADAIAPDRQKVVDAYAAVLKMPGDATRGAKVFAKTCAACHKLGDVGHVVGPDLASVGDKSPQGLLIAVLDPNRVVEARYVNYVALTKNGQTFSGVLASETGNSVTLLGAEGKQQVILRSDLDELSSTGKSVMPEGLEKDIPVQDMADVIAYVRSVGPQPKRKTFDGNKPETVRPATDGSLLLSASNGEIYGSTIVLEKQHGNLGWWTSDDDHVIWAVEVTKAGRYAVWLDYACDDKSAGKTFLLQTGTAELKGKVEGTGTWDKYQQKKVGEVVLSAGAQRLTLRSASKLYASPMLDLKAMKLVPVEK